ncbi:MAG: MBL fold metallo-hydrolase [Bacteroidota bacterium]
MKIKFCGAARAVTGSAHLIELDSGYTILLDCGLYQGRAKEMKEFNETWLFDPLKVDSVILSHAHIDHSGRLPRLVRDGFEGTIHATHATRSLCAIMLLDSAFIQQREAQYYNKRKRRKLGTDEFQHKDPLYEEADVTKTMKQFIGYGYNRWFRVSEQVEVLFKDAGHILGSASVSMRITENEKTTTIGFSGDIGRPNRPILRDPIPMEPADYVICESTYGDKEHLAAPSELEKFLAIIKHTCVEKKGKLLIPAFSVGRTQEIVYMLDQLETAGKLPHIPVYVDSPLAVNATTIFGAHPECFDNELNKYLLIDDNPFGFNALTYVKEVDVSKQLNQSEEPCIIISSSGMMNAGRVRHHLFHAIDKKKNTILIVGYCAPQTPGGMLRSGKRTLRMFGENKTVRADIEIMDSFSAHADRNEMVDYLDNQKRTAKGIFLVHGEIDRQEKFKILLARNDFPKVVIPQLGESFEL